MQTRVPTPKEELTQAAIKGVVSAIPVVGGLISELGACLVSPLDKRKRLWTDEVEAALAELASKYNRLPGALAEDPAFVTALLKATSAALATHEKLKLEALRAFIVAVGSKALSDEELQHALVRLVGDLSVGHVEVLRFIEADYEAVSTNVRLEEVFIRYNSEYRGKLDRMAFRWILSDLAARMVVHLGDIEDMSEFASKRESILRESSEIRPLQITGLGFRLLDLLKEKSA